MAVDSDVATRILIEIQTGKEPARPDTPDESQLREQMTRECEQIRAQGMVVDVPNEIPG